MEGDPQPRRSDNKNKHPFCKFSIALPLSSEMKTISMKIPLYAFLSLHCVACNLSI